MTQQSKYPYPNDPQPPMKPNSSLASMPPASQHVRRLCEGSMSPSLIYNKKREKHQGERVLGAEWARTKTNSSTYRQIRLVHHASSYSKLQKLKHLWKYQPPNSEASKAAEPPDWRCHHVHPELSELEPLIIRGTTISAGHDDYVRGYPYWSIRLDYSRVDVIWLYQRVPPDKLTSLWKITISMKSHSDNNI